MKHSKTKKPSTRVSLIFITPKSAALWLKKNTDNRKVYPKLVQRYATDIKNDAWELSVDMIIFDEKGMLLNGQHRLHAVMTAGQGIWAYVGHGFNKMSQFTCDQGKKRTIADAIRIRDEISVGNLGLAVAAQLYGEVRWKDLTLDQRRKWYFKHRKAVEFSVNAVNHKCRAAVASVIARASYKEDQDKLADFAWAVVDPDHAVEKAGAANKLRIWLDTLKGVSGSTVNKEIRGKTRAALRAFLAGKSLQKLYVVEEDIHKLPGEKK